MTRLSARLFARSTRVVDQLEARQRSILLFWVMLAAVGSGLRLGITPAGDLTGTGAMLPYLLVTLAPAFAFLFALEWFPQNASWPQPAVRLARYGNWRPASDADRASPLFGPAGIMASLIVGMLLNIPLRAAEFLTAIPPLQLAQPGWLHALYAMSLADVTIVSSLYAIGAVMALRAVPLFPRFLLLVWAVDLGMQLATAAVIAQVGGLPASVAEALGALLAGNIKKVLISVALWAPYLLLSARVNLTYRNRVRIR
jgi:hypothetical protein